MARTGAHLQACGYTSKFAGTPARSADTQRRCVPGAERRLISRAEGLMRKLNTPTDLKYSRYTPPSLPPSPTAARSRYSIASLVAPNLAAFKPGLAWL